MLIKRISRNSDYPYAHIICGTHGDEQNSIRVVWDFYKFVKNANDSYNYVFYFLVNESACKARKRDYQPLRETKDLNRSFEESTELKDIIDEIKAIDRGVVLDVHSSPLCNNTVLIDYNNTSELYFSIANKFDLNPMVRRTQNHGTIKKYFVDKEIPSFTVELSPMTSNGSVENDVNFIARAVHALVEIKKGIGIIDKLPCSPNVLTQQIYCPFKRAVIKWNRAGLGKYNIGDKIATLEDMDTLRELDILAPEDLIVQDICGDISFEGQPILEYSPRGERNENNESIAG